jgi:hypothetical protein
MKVIENLKRNARAVVVSVAATGAVVLGSASTFADAAVPASLMDAGALEIVNDFAADLVPTILSIIIVVIPVGLTLFGIGFALKKGIGYLMKKAKSAF